MSNLIIAIEDIENDPDKKLEVGFDDKIDGIKTVGNIKADIQLTSMGEFIQIRGHVEGIAILECDLCLDEFKQEINLDIDEMFAKNSLMEEYSQETEIKEGQFVTDLMGAKEIDICDLLYQSVILSFPNKKVCGINCKGDTFQKEEELQDPRLDVFKHINIEKRK